MNRPEIHRKLLGLKIKIGLVVYDRVNNLQHWLNCWQQCEKLNAEVIVIHTGTDDRFEGLCNHHAVKYIKRENVGFDIGCFQDVCKERLAGFPNDWDLLFWVTDDTMPMRHDFLFEYTSKMLDGRIGISCMHLSKDIRRHVRTTGFCIRKQLSKNLNFLAEPITTKGECYEFEHGVNNMLVQTERMGYKCGQPLPIMQAAVWDKDFGLTTSRRREHEMAFRKRHIEIIEKPEPPVEPPIPDPIEPPTVNYPKTKGKICITTTFDRHYKEAGKTLFNSIRRHTDCTGIDFKVITSDIEVVNELGKENCHFITEEIKARYANVKYSDQLPKEKYSSSWHRYEVFNFTKYDRVICIDSDCICVHDISYLFSTELDKHDLISVEDHFVSKLLPPLYSQLEANGWDFTGLYKRVATGKVDIQPAVFIANKSIINGAWYSRLLTYANNTKFTYSIDQGILNNFIYQEDLKIKLLPLEWNYQDLYAIRCPELPVADPIIIHCQESKPFKRERADVDERIQKFYDQWRDERNYDGHWKSNARMKGKICITTTFDYNYTQAGQTLFKSIRHHTDCEGIDFKVITNDPKVIAEWGAENCHIITDEIKARYANVKYITDLPKEKYEPSWYRYEMFNLEGYDRVICIDSDCICIEDISYLFSEELNQYDLISTEDMIVARMFKQNIPALEQTHGLDLRGLSRRIEAGEIDIQPALLVANRKIVNNQWYHKLLTYANETGHTYSVDEGILNDFIYLDGLNVKVLPMEWNYMDTYGAQILELPVPYRPFIVHCQESKPFKKQKKDVNSRIHKWYDRWWEEATWVEVRNKTLVVIIVWNRFQNLKLWIDCWNQCYKAGAELVVIHNLETDNDRYAELCRDNGIRYVPRENKGFDLGAFQDVCRERLQGFPNDWDNLIWITDDCIPMAKDFVKQYLDKLKEGYIPCYEISDLVKRHIRTTAFTVTKEIAKNLIFPKDPMGDREDCYQFEHKGINMYDQIVSMGGKPLMIVDDLMLSPLWDSGVSRAHLNLMGKHEEIFTPVKINVPDMIIDSVLDSMAIQHKSDKCSRYHNYAVKYDKILAPFREAFTSILEIGVSQGQSTRMWADYFPNATIHGADISPASANCVDYSDRIKFHLLDQRDEAQLKNMEQYSPFDLIIDDGNHWWFEQILTFETLFPYLRSGGIYIVEDLTTSYWQEYANHPISPVEYFKALADDVHLKGRRGSVPVNPPQEFGDMSNGWHRREDCHVDVPDFESIQFFNGFVAIFKR